MEDGYAQVAVAGTKSFAAPGIPLVHCRVHRIGPPEPDNGFGPDLAFIQLPEEYAMGLGESGKRFYDLASHRVPAMALSPATVGEPRIIFAIPAEATSRYQDEEPTGPVTRFAVTTQAFASIITATEERDGYDYVDFSLEEPRSDDFPADYRGVSGSGLWWVGERDAAGRVVSDPNRILLEGVVVRHHPRHHGREFLRCHGRNSVYRFYDDCVTAHSGNQ